jgi:hypothetical protein
MNLERKLKLLFDAIRVEVRENAALRARLSEFLDEHRARKNADAKQRLESGERDASGKLIKRGNRRRQATVDPISEIRQGPEHLRKLLNRLDIEQLRDVVADYRMDPNKLVMKWQDKGRLIEHIVETSVMRGKKGDAFRA